MICTNAGSARKSIAHELTEKGFRSRRGAPMNKQTVAEWFRNPYPHAGCVVWEYAGPEVATEAAGSSGSSLRTPIPQSSRWRLLIRRIGKRRRGGWGGCLPRRGDYLLSGVMRCGECGAKMIVNSNRKRNQAFYVCGSRQRRKDGCSNRLMLHQPEVERQVVEWIKKTLLDAEFLEAYFQRVQEASEASSERESAER